MDITLDGKKYGWIIKNLKNERFFGKQQPIKFINLQLAESFLSRKNYCNPEDYNIYMMIEENIIPISKIQKVYDHYETYLNSELIIIHEQVQDIVLRSGYFVFNDGDKFGQNGGNVEEKKICKNLFESINRVFIDDMKEDHLHIKSISRRYHEFVVSIKGTTLKIHILYNGKICSINLLRKNDGLNMFKFIKGMDNNTAFYMYAVVDSNDRIDREIYGENIDLMIDDIIIKLSEENTIKYIPIVLKKPNPIYVDEIKEAQYDYQIYKAR